MDLEKEIKVGDKVICAGEIVVVEHIDLDYIHCKSKILTFVVRPHLITPMTRVLEILLCP